MPRASPTAFVTARNSGPSLIPRPRARRSTWQKIEKSAPPHLRPIPLPARAVVCALQLRDFICLNLPASTCWFGSLRPERIGACHQLDDLAVLGEEVHAPGISGFDHRATVDRRQQR
jgi:hypothetical protein